MFSRNGHYPEGSVTINAGDLRSKRQQFHLGEALNSVARKLTPRRRYPISRDLARTLSRVSVEPAIEEE